jgi:hypothetical protein
MPVSPCSICRRYEVGLAIRYYNIKAWEEGRKASHGESPAWRWWVVFFVCLYSALAFFMAEKAGFRFVVLYFGFFGGGIFLLRGIPALLGERGRFVSYRPDPITDPSYRALPYNIYHERNSSD